MALVAICLGLGGPSHAASISSTYTIHHHSFPGGGGRSVSPTYAVESALGGFRGLAQSTAGETVIWLGHIGQFSPAPSFSGLINISADGGVSPVVSFTINDLATPASALELSAASSNLSLIPNSNISLGGDGVSRTIQVRSAPGQTGSATITVRAADADGIEITGSFVVSVAAPAPQLTPQIIWAQPSAIIYGTALGPLQLNAQSDVTGAFSYEPPSGTVLSAGVNQTVSMTFTPDDLVTYKPVVASVLIEVQPAPLTITAENKVKSAGQVLPVLTASYTGFVNNDTAVSLDVAPVLTTTATASSPAGVYPITVSGASDANYTITHINGTLTVSPKLVPVINWTAPSAIVYGTALSGAQLNATANVAGSFTYSPAVGTVLSAGASQTLSVTFTPSDAASYEIATATVQITVNGAPLTITAENKVKQAGQALPPLTASYNGFVNNDTAASLDVAPVITTTATASSPAGAYPITVSGASDANYTITHINGTLTVSPKLVPVINWTAPSAIVYGTALSAGQLNATANVAGTFTYTPAAGTVLSAGASQTLSVTFTPSDAASYETATAAVQITVNRAPLTITADNKVKSAGQAVPTLTASYTGFVNNDTAASLDVAPVLSTTATASSAAGAYPITVSGASDANYTITHINGTLTVSAKLVPVIKWTAPSAIVYGTALSGAQLNATANVAGSFTYSPAVGTVLSAGASQTLSVTFTPSDAATHETATAAVQITVNRAPLTITADNKVKQAGQALPPLTASYTGFVNNDTAASLDVAPVITTTATASSPAGAYPITVSGASDANYTITHINGTLTVSPKLVPVINWTAPSAIVYGTALSTGQLNATANVAGSFTYSPAVGTVLSAGASQTLSVTFTPSDTATHETVTATVQITVNRAPLTITADNKVKQAGQALPPLTASYTGFVYNDTAASLDVEPVLTTTATASSPAGAYPITVSGASDANYNITHVNGTLSVSGKLVPVITWSAPSAIVYGTALSGAQLNATANVAGSFAYSPAVGTVLSAGASQTLSVTFTPSDAATHETATAAVQITVNRAPLTITADNKVKQAGQALPPLTASYTGFANNDTAASLDVAPVLTTTATASSPAGAYPITVSGASDANYNITHVNGTLTVSGKLVPVITWSAPSAIVYGTALSAAQLNATASVAGTFAYSPALETVLPAGASQTLSVTFTPNDTATHETVTATVQITVNRAPLTITADNKVKSAGQAVPALTASYTGFVNNDTTASLDAAPVLTTTATASSPAGAYPITVSGASDANYTITHINGTLTVSAKLVPVIKWTAPSAIVYGTALSGAQLNATANVAGSFAYSPAVGTVLSAGASQTLSVTFTPSDAATHETATAAVQITVNRAPLTITADNKVKQAGQALPPLTASYTGFANNDTAASLDVAPVLTTTATASSPAGAYPITVSGASDANYNITHVNGTLTVSGKLVPVITWSAPSAIVYGTALSAAQLNATASVAGTFAYTPAAGTVLSAGASQSLSVIFTPSDNASHETTTATVQITVNRTPLTITADNKSRAFGKANPIFTGTVTGLVSPDSIAVSFTSTANEGSSTGVHPIVPRVTDPAGVLSNYAVQLVQGSLTIIPAQPVNTTLTGVVYDGYVAGANVYFDANNNGLQEPGEPATTTDEDGRFDLELSLTTFDTNLNGRLDFTEGSIVVTGGMDILTGLPLKNALIAPAGSKVVSPLTTLVWAVIEGNPSASIAQAEAIVAGSLGLPSGVSLTSYDPFNESARNDPAAILVLSAASQVQDTLVQIAALVGAASGQSSGAAMQSVTHSMAASGQAGSMALTRADVVQTLINQSAANLGTVINPTVSEHAARLVALGNLAKHLASSSSPNAPSAALAVSPHQSASQSAVALALAQAGLPNTPLQNAVALIGDASLFQKNVKGPVGVLSGADDRPGEFGFTQMQFERSEIGATTARVTVARNNGTKGAGIVLLNIRRPGAATNTLTVTLGFAHRELAKTVDLWAPLQARPTLLEDDTLELRLAAPANAAPGTPVPGASNTATLLLKAPPAWVELPAPAEAFAGGQIVLRAQASGAPRPTYQWFKNAELLTNQSGPALLIEDVQPQDAGLYHVVARNASGVLPSPAVQLIVAPAPALSSTATNGLVAVGGTMTLTASVQRTNSFTYQWLRNGLAVAGGTQPSLVVSQFVTSDEGRYQLTVTGEGGKAVSEEFVVRLPRPEFSLAAPQRQPNGSVELLASAPLGRSYLLQTSSNLLNWTFVSLVSPSETPRLIVDPDGGQPLRFYRMQLLPAFKLSAPRRTPEGPVQITLNAPAGFRFSIESSPDLQSWTRVATVTPAQDLAHITLPFSVAEEKLFYRANLLP